MNFVCLSLVSACYCSASAFAPSQSAIPAIPKQSGCAFPFTEVRVCDMDGMEVCADGMGVHMEVVRPARCSCFSFGAGVQLRWRLALVLFIRSGAGMLMIWRSSSTLSRASPQGCVSS
ncbi:hypothetical protein DFH08DRAFT_429547 [Mycena albidolilacea]|uniref:Secreted protein n=1 Tax=Mycena albidolilacea TaxID=1033008 RepID=A0AAD6ZAM4_9AGAR|nr:hypothetical protein DFH08DRAFT_429547 [Mycena albidolilacea]